MASTRIVTSPPASINEQPPQQGDPLFSRRLRLSDLKSRALWLGDYDYRSLFAFGSCKLPFFGPHEPLPVVLAVVLGLQHALASKSPFPTHTHCPALHADHPLSPSLPVHCLPTLFSSSITVCGGLVVPPLLLGGSAGAALSSDEQTYLVAASLIWCGLGTVLQCSRIPLGRGFYLGSGVLNVIGTSFVFVGTGLTYINNEFNRDGGLCSFDADGNKLPCREAFGAMLGSASTVAVIAVLLSFTPPRYLRKIFTPLITGSVLLTIGLSLVSSGMTNWAGGSSCQSGGLCSTGAPWGSAKNIGLGFSVWISIILFDLLGPPLIKNCSSMLGFLVGIIIAAACGYFQSDVISSAPAGTFLWVHRFPLSVKGELILPFLAAYLVVVSEAIGNITATCDASLLPIEGIEFGQRIQGGLLSDTLWAALAGLATVSPSTTFSQNVSVISLSNNASRVAGYVCAGILLLMGIVAKFGAVWVACPPSTIGGLTTYLFSAVAVAGLRILAGVNWTRRTRFIATAALSIGFADICTPEWFEHFFTYSGNNHTLSGFLEAVTLVVSEPYLAVMIIAIPLQLIAPYGEDDLAAMRAAENASEYTRSTAPGGNKYSRDLEAAREADGMALEPVDTK
ncbi:hypothetical protein JCM10213_003145 [Rhodosporidiobolus nylandii]